jgi:hypothetical protein
MLPNLIIIGGMKCGTTSLHYYLHQHPQISMCREKELNFFILEHNWHKGIEWYQSNFTGEEKVHGEASPGYTNPFFAGVPERMHSIAPHVKLIYILRDPIDRIISHYIDYYATRRENRKLADALRDLDDNPCILQSKYYTQLRRYLDYYLKGKILIITLEDLHRDPRQTMKDVFGFLDVDSSFYSPSFSTVKHASSSKRRLNRFGHFLAQTVGLRLVARLPPDIRQRSRILLSLPLSRKIEPPVLSDSLRKDLIDNLRDDINRLREFTGKDFEDWCL